MGELEGEGVRVDLRKSCVSVDRWIDERIDRRTGERAKDELPNDYSDGTGLAERTAGKWMGRHACGTN